MAVQTSQRGSLRAFAHPIRVRILAELAGRDGFSAAELHEALGDVPLPSLYRHLDELLRARLIAVAHRRDARGPAERVFALAQGEIGGDVRANPATAIRVFTGFCTMLIGQFTRYVHRARRRGVPPIFRGWAVYADDAEFERLTAELVALAERAERIPPERGRTRRFLSVVTIPEA